MSSFLAIDNRLNKTDKATVLFLVDSPNEAACRIKKPMSPDQIKTFSKVALESKIEPTGTFILTCCPHMTEDTYNVTKQRNEFIKSHREKLFSYITRLDPKVIVPMGANAINAISTKQQQITKVRGQFQSVDINGKEYEVLPVFGLSQVIRDPSTYISLLRDFEKLKLYVDSNYKEKVTEQVKAHRDYRYVTDLQFLLDKPPKWITFDTETTGLEHFKEDVKPFLLGISYRDNESLLIPIDEDWKADLLERDHKKLMSQVKALMSNESIKKVAHNVKFDYQMLKKVGVEVKGEIHDTLLVVRMLDENIKDKSLNNSVAIYLPEYNGFNDELEANIDKSDMWNLPLDTLRQYAGNDTCILYKLAKVIIPKLKEDEAHYKIYQDLLIPATINIANTLEYDGYTIDTNRIKDLSEELNDLIEEQKRKILTLIPKKAVQSWVAQGKKMNLGSTQFLTHVLFGKDGFKLKPLEFTKTTAKLKDKTKKVPTVGAAHLKELQEVNDCPIISELLTLKSYNKMKTTYVGDPELGTGLNQFIHNGKLRPFYMLHKTVTLRTASDRPNGQNLPKRGPAAKAFRSLIVSRPDYKLVQIDYSQAELRIMAWIANVKAMIEAYEKGYDLHVITGASNLLKSGQMPTKPKSDSIDDLVEWFSGFKKTDKELYELKRFQAKGSNFSLIYMVSLMGFISYAKSAFGRYDLTKEGGQAEYDAFYSSYPELLTYFALATKFTEKHGFIRNKFGLRRHLPEVRVSSEHNRAIRQAINFTDQSVGAIISLLAFNEVCAFRDSLEDPNDFYICGFVHDALIFEIREEKVDDLLPKIALIMENVPLKEKFGVDPTVTFPVDAELGTNLAELKEYDFRSKLP